MEDKKKYRVYSNGEVRFLWCPICKEYNEDNPHFSVNKEKGVYKCHKTGKGGNIKELDNFDIDSIEIPPQEEKQQINFNKIMIDKASNKLDNEWVEYLKRRGISSKYLDKFCRLGKNKSMLIPITDGEKVVGIKYRTIDKKLSSEKGSDTRYLLNWQNVPKGGEYLIITEGEIDLLSCIEIDFYNTVSLPFGANNLKCIEHNIDYLRSFKRIIIATDNDGAGRTAKEKIVEQLKGCKLFELDLKGFKDLNEVLQKAGGNTLKEFINNATHIKKEKDNAPFYVNNNEYYNREGKRITDFLLRIEGYSNTHFKGVSIQRGYIERKFLATKEALSTRQGINNHLGYYVGSPQSIPLFWCWIEEENDHKRMETIEHYGIIDNKYYDPTSPVICSKYDLYIVPLKDIEDLTEEERAWASSNLVYMRSDTNQSLLGLCWAFGRFHISENYPILEVAGTTSIGKTEYVEFISRLLFGSKDNIKNFTTLSNHQIRSLASCSNITPLAIDEIKITGNKQKEQGETIYSIVRSVFDNKTVNQGTTEEQLKKFKLCTPLIISGESELGDTSIKNRMIRTELTRANKGEEGIFFKLKDTKILEKIGKAGLNDRLLNGAIVISKEEIRQAVPEIKDSRQQYIVGCLLLGLKALKRVISIDEEIERGFISFLNTKMNEEVSVVSNFIELLELAMESTRDTTSFYKIENGRHFAIFNELYKVIAEEYKKTHSTIELLGATTLKKQLIEEGVIVADRVSKRFVVDSFTNKARPCKCVEFNSEIIKEVCRQNEK